MRLKRKFRPAKLGPEAEAWVQHFEGDVCEMEKRSDLVAVVYEPTDEPEDGLTPGQRLDRWYFLAGLLLGGRDRALSERNDHFALLFGRCLMVVNELAGDRMLYAEQLQVPPAVEGEDQQVLNHTIEEWLRAVGKARRNPPPP
jgi:hypothetical protein